MIKVLFRNIKTRTLNYYAKFVIIIRRLIYFIYLLDINIFLFYFKIMLTNNKYINA